MTTRTPLGGYLFLYEKTQLTISPHTLDQLIAELQRSNQQDNAARPLQHHQQLLLHWSGQYSTQSHHLAILLTKSKLGNFHRNQICYIAPYL